MQIRFCLVAINLSARINCNYTKPTFCKWGITAGIMTHVNCVDIMKSKIGNYAYSLDELFEAILQVLYDEILAQREYERQIQSYSQFLENLERTRKALEQRVYRQQHTLDDVKQLCIQNRWHVAINNVRGEIRTLSKSVNNCDVDTFKAAMAQRTEELDAKCLLLCYEWAKGDDELANDIYKACELINDAYYQRLHRLKARVERMCDIGCCFLTLTFDDMIEQTNETTRRKYVQRFLNGFDVPYIANVDYGSTNGREHYHAVICAPLEQLALETWGKGYVYYEEVGTTRVYRDDKGIYERKPKKRDETPEHNGARTSKYMNKLTNHAIKETAKGHNIMYCRNIDHKLFDMETEIKRQYAIDLYERAANRPRLS